MDWRLSPTVFDADTARPIVKKIENTKSSNLLPLMETNTCVDQSDRPPERCLPEFVVEVRLGGHVDHNF